MSSFKSFLESLIGQFDPKETAEQLALGAAALTSQARTNNTQIPDMIIQTSGQELTPFFTDGKSLLYPQDLFTPGNEAFILFHVREPTQAQTKICKRIALYMPPDIRVNYGAEWETINMNLFQSSEAGENVLNEVKAAYNTGGEAQAVFDAVIGVGKTLGGNTVRNVAALVDQNTIGAQIQRQLNVALNPHAALKFNTIGFREFEFTFQLFARNADESESIRKIIKMFKWAMHPEASKTLAGGVLEKIYWDYPHTFDIFLLTPSTKYLFNISQSALIDMGVNYGGSGIATFFKGTGAPVHVELTLRFRELEVLTKQRIQEDY